MPHSRPMASIGPHCHELRIRDEDRTWRIVYRLDPGRLLVAGVFAKNTRDRGGLGLRGHWSNVSHNLASGEAGKVPRAVASPKPAWRSYHAPTHAPGQPECGGVRPDYERDRHQHEEPGSVHQVWNRSGRCQAPRRASASSLRCGPGHQLTAGDEMGPSGCVAAPGNPPSIPPLQGGKERRKAPPSSVCLSPLQRGSWRGFRPAPGFRPDGPRSSKGVPIRMGCQRAKGGFRPLIGSWREAVRFTDSAWLPAPAQVTCGTSS